MRKQGVFGHKPRWVHGGNIERSSRLQPAVKRRAKYKRPNDGR